MNSPSVTQHPRGSGGFWQLPRETLHQGPHPSIPSHLLYSCLIPKVSAYTPLKALWTKQSKRPLQQKSDDLCFILAKLTQTQAHRGLQLLSLCPSLLRISANSSPLPHSISPEHCTYPVPCFLATLVYFCGSNPI